MLERWRGLSTRSRAVVAAALLYSILHFAYSGVWYPFRQYSSMVQMDQEMLPLQQHLGSGRPVTLDNPRQYGPTFFFVMHPLLRWASD